MGFKVASRVRGLSDEAFREAFGTEEQWPLGAGPAALAGRLPLPLPAAIAEHCVLAGRSLYQCYRCKKQTSLHGGHDLPRHQAAADAVVRGRPPDRNGEERDFLGRAGAPSRGQAADRLDHEAQDHGGDGAARGRHAAVRGGWRWTMLTSAARAPAASGAVARRARRPSWRRSPPAPRAGRARSSWSPVKGFRKREIARGAKRWLAPRKRRSSPTACAAGTRSTGSSEAISAIRTGSGRTGRPHGALQMGQHDARQHQERDHRNLPQARPRSCPTPPRQLRLAIQPALPAPDTMIPRFVHSAARTQPMPIPPRSSLDDFHG